MQDRIRWVDTFKGILIILMVMGHSNTPLVTYVYLFHMAAFMIISGYSYKSWDISIVKYLWRKTKGVLIPFFVINMCFIFLAYVFSITIERNVEYIAMNSVFESLRGLFSIRATTSELGGPSWYLLVIFEGEILCQIVVRTINYIFDWKGKERISCGLRRSISIVFIVLMGVLGFYVSSLGYYLPFNLDLGLTSCLFLGIGMFVREYKTRMTIDNTSMAIISLTGILFFGGAYFNGRLPVNWPTRQFPPIWIVVILSIFGSFLIYICSKQLVKINMDGMINYIGKNTFAILMYHFIAFRVLSCILIGLGIRNMNELVQSPPSTFSSFLWIIYTVFAVAFCTLLSKYSSRYAVLDYLVNARIKKREIKNEN